MPWLRATTRFRGRRQVLRGIPQPGGRYPPTWGTATLKGAERTTTHPGFPRSGGQLSKCGTPPPGLAVSQLSDAVRLVCLETRWPGDLGEVDPGQPAQLHYPGEHRNNHHSSDRFWLGTRRSRSRSLRCARMRSRGSTAEDGCLPLTRRSSRKVLSPENANASDRCAQQRPNLG